MPSAATAPVVHQKAVCPTDSKASASPRRTRLLPSPRPGDRRTYEVRDQLRGLGLRWDPATHAWHGTIRPDDQVVLTTQLRVKAQVVLPIEAFATEEPRAPPAASKSLEPGSRAAGEPQGQPRDGSRTCAEARRVYRDGGDNPEWSTDPRFTVWDVTSGLPDDSREADERAAERRLRDLRGRVKAARAALSAQPGALETLRADWRREAAFYARFGITQAQFRIGVAVPA